jgi:hypothetical protein
MAKQNHLVSFNTLLVDHIKLSNPLFDEQQKKAANCRF